MTTSKTALLGGVLVIAACGNSRQRVPTSPAEATSRPVAAPAEERAVDNPPLKLPIAAKSELLPAKAYPIFVTGSTLLIGSPPAAVLQLPGAEERGQFGFGEAYKDSKYAGYVLPLGKAMAQRTCDAGGRVPKVAVIYMDADMQYRIFIDLLYSLSLLGYNELFLATRTSLTAPTNQTTTGVRIRARSTASHLVKVNPNGLSLYEQNGAPVGPGCTAVTREPSQLPPCSPCRKCAPAPTNW